MNIFRAMAVEDLDEVTRAIPVIDFAPAFLGEPGGLDAVAAEVRHAGHGGPGEVVDAAASIIPTWSRARRCAGATNGRRATRPCARP